MKLRELLKGIAVNGEVMTDAVRRQYIEDLEQLEKEGTGLPGNPNKFLVASQSTLMPSKMRTTFKIRAWMGKDEEVEADFATDKKRKSWWRREPGCTMEVEVVWDAHEAPEAIARTRVIGENELDHRLKTTPWTALTPTEEK